MKYVALIALSFASLTALAQITFEPKENTPLTFEELETQFIEWSKENDLKDVKGWKWYKRWEHFYAQRANGNGNLEDPATFLKEAVDNVKDKKKPSNVAKSSWVPAGPDFKPPSPNPYSGHGVSRINCIEFHPTDPNTFWVGASQGGIWKTTDSGANWSPISDDLPILRISDIEVDPNNPSTIYACVGDFEYNAVSLQLDDRKRHTHYGLGVYKTTDGGATWAPTGLTVLQTDLDYSLLRRVIVDPTNSDNVVAVGLEGAWKSTDGGTTWTNTLPDYLLCDLEIDESSPNVLYAGSSHSVVLNDGTSGVFKSADFGDTWNLLNTGIPSMDGKRIEVAIAPSNSSYVYALVVDQNSGFYGMFRSTDAGNTWNQQSNGSPTNILAWSDGVGEVGGQGSYDLALLIDPNNENLLHVGGVNMWGSDDGGVTWDGTSYWLPYYGPNVHADQHQFKYNPADDKYYVCNDGGIYRTDSIIIGSWWDADNTSGYQWPTVWEDISDGMQITSFYRLSTRGNEILAGAQDNSTFYYDGVNWSNVIGGDGMECVFHPTDPNIFWGSWQYGGLARTFDGGNSFDWGLGDPIKATEEGEWVTPYLYSTADDGLFAGYGNVWASYNNGDSWSQLSNFSSMPGAGYPSPASALVRSKNNAATFYVAKRIYHSYNQLSEVYVTHDMGSTWTDITAGLPDSLYFTYLAVDDDDPNLAWITCSGFNDGEKVYKTIDGGQNWTNISGSLPNIPVNCIVLDETSDYYNPVFIGTDLGVYYYDPETSDWELYSNNLPNVIVSELEINYSTGELYAATFGRGIWKTVVPLSVQSQSPSTPLQLYPNPNSGEFSIVFESPTVAFVDIEIIDIKGSVVHSLTYELQVGVNTISINKELENGVYFVALKNDQLYSAQKFVVE